jgi:hypothetical protein
MSAGDELVEALLSSRELSAIERINVTRAGKLQDFLDEQRRLFRNGALFDSDKVRLNVQISKAENELGRILRELRLSAERAERVEEEARQEEARYEPASPPVRRTREGGPSPERRAQLHAAVASSRERTARLRAAQQAADAPADAASGEV